MTRVIPDVVARIDASLSALVERRDVEVAQAARETFRSVLTTLRELKKQAVLIDKKDTEDVYKRADASFLMSRYMNYAVIRGIPVWIMGEKLQTMNGFTQTIAPGIWKQRLGVWLEFPCAENKRYGGVYVHYARPEDRTSGGDVHVVLREAKSLEDFGDPLWFGLHAADLFENCDSIFVHELTHHWDTMRSKDIAGYEKSTRKGRTAFWSSPEGSETPKEYLLSNNEINARFMEFTSACIRQIDIAAYNAEKDFRTVDDAAKKAGSSFENYTGGSSARDFVESLVFSTFFGSSAHSFVSRIRTFGFYSDFPRAYSLMDNDMKKRYDRRLAALYLDLSKYANGLIERILQRKRLALSMKRVKVGKGYGYKHK